MADINIRRIQAGDKTAVIALAREIWGDESSGNLEQHWEWKFETNPANMGEDPVVWIAEDEGRVVATVAGMWVRVKLGPVVERHIWTTDLMTAAEYRGRIGLQIGKHSMFWGPHITMGYPMNKRVYALWMRLGGFETAPLYEHSCVVRPEYRLTPRGVPLPVARLCGYAWRCAMVLRSNFVKGADTDVQIEEIDAFGPAYDDLWERLSDRYVISTVRDSAYLRWRFTECPSRRYQILQATRNGTLAGYLVFRVTNDERARTGYIVDTLIDHRDSGAMRSLFLHAIGLMSGDRVDSVRFYTTDRDPELLRNLRRVGFFASRIANRGCYYDNREDKPGADTTIAASWHATRSDSDLDLY